MDVLDHLLSDLRQESCVICILNATEPWRIQKHLSGVVPFYAVLSGKARIETANGVEDLRTGDFLVLPGGAAHQLSGAQAAAEPPMPLMQLCREAGVEPWQPGVRYRKTTHLRHGGGGAQSVILIGIFSFGDPTQNPLLAALPPVLVVRAGEEGTWLGMTLKALNAELSAEQPGSNVVVSKMSDLLFAQALRAYLTQDHGAPVGWIRGITDSMVGQALAQIHSAPERHWTLQSLAVAVGSSRAVFAQRFRLLVGQGAMGYLTSWRMYLATGMLLTRSDNIVTVAGKVGYRSEAGFSIAFKRFAGISPNGYRTRMRGQSPVDLN